MTLFYMVTIPRLGSALYIQVSAEQTGLYHGSSPLTPLPFGGRIVLPSGFVERLAPPLTATHWMPVALPRPQVGTKMSQAIGKCPRGGVGGGKFMPSCEPLPSV